MLVTDNSDDERLVLGAFQKNNIVKGMIISLFTTFLSALFLSLSDFVVISDFGLSLMIWIFVLSFYVGFRIYLVQSKNWSLSWLNYFSNHVKIEKYILI